MNSLIGDRFFRYIVTSIYSICCVYLYVDFAYPTYSYIGWQLNDNYSIFGIILTSLLSSLIVLFINKKVSRPIDLLVLFSFLLIYIPSINLGNIVLDNNSGYGVLCGAYTMSMIILLFFSKVEISTISNLGLKTNQFKYFLIFIITIMYFLVLLSYKPDVSNVYKLIDFSDVYDIRENYKERTQEVGLINYLFTWLIKIFIPLLLVFGMVKKNKLIKYGAFILVFPLFLISGHKSIILSLILVYLFYILLKKNEIKGGLNFNIIIYYLTGSILVGCFLSYLNINLINDVLFRRAILVPGVLSNMYFDFFSKNEHTYLAYSFLSSFFDYKYNINPPFVIGDYYFGRIQMSANANYWASGFAEFGVFGTIIMTFIAGFYYKILDCLNTFKEDKLLGCALVIAPTWALMDSALPIVLITHGLILVIFLIYLFPSKN